ncbi:alpha-ketoglutarate-dependent taurine dioxygenase [Catenuloplanes nepalensis]|uniref:Alpha-ketoglutarate-dependent taurine dioxygenase n=1 Tax=Catenuloplanes nepalensis TaxID=587533 RepID=A0ABT9MMH3_9ACTN|nr:TauD/TfdA family dioxygenase [Catenuloplanes nepalensis]MDP9792526.1 alpha-ketoglutarate-dependent taurine dioxygenase [Catenuloplanes nepalensis]
MITHCSIDPDDLSAVGRLMAVVARDGVVTFDGVPDRPSLLRLGRAMLKVRTHRDSEPDGITVIHDRGKLARRAGNAGLGHERLSLHTESSALPRPPELLMLYCAQAAASGGDCHLADGAVLAQELAQHHPDLLDVLCEPRNVLFGGAAGFLGSPLTVTGARMSIRMRSDSLARYAPPLARRLPEVHRILSRITISVRLQPGTGYLLSNTRWLHGREEYDAGRVMYRLLGDPRAGYEVLAGFPRPLQTVSAR